MEAQSAAAEPAAAEEAAGQSWSRACWLGDLRTLQEYIDRGLDLNSRCAKGSTPLGLAAGYGRVPAVQLLITANADLDAACDNSGETPIIRAARFGRTACVEFLLTAGALLERPDCNGWTALHHAAGRGHAQTAAALCEQARPSAELLLSALVVTSQFGHQDCVRVLLDARAAPNGLTEGKSPLVTAAAWGHSGIVACLLVSAAPCF